MLKNCKPHDLVSKYTRASHIQRYLNPRKNPFLKSLPISITNDCILCVFVAYYMTDIRKEVYKHGSNHNHRMGRCTR